MKTSVSAPKKKAVALRASAIKKKKKTISPKKASPKAMKVLSAKASVDSLLKDDSIVLRRATRDFEKELLGAEESFEDQELAVEELDEEVDEDLEGDEGLPNWWKDNPAEVDEQDLDTDDEFPGGDDPRSEYDDSDDWSESDWEEGSKQLGEDEF